MKCQKCGVKLRTFEEKIMGVCENCVNLEHYYKPKKEQERK